MSKKIVGLIIFTSFISIGANGQTIREQKLNASLEQWYDSNVSLENAPLIDGIEYLPRLIGKISDPFYLRREPFKGAIDYKGQQYQNVSFIYDIYQDILVLSHNQNNSVPILMEIDEREVASFELEGRKFETISIRDSTEIGVSSGYFEVIVTSKDSRFLSKRIKEDYLYNARREFQDRHLYFIQSNDDQLTPVKTKRDFLKLYMDRSADIKEFIRQERLKIKPWNEQDLLQLYRFCNPEKL